MFSLPSTVLTAFGPDAVGLHGSKCEPCSYVPCLWHGSAIFPRCMPTRRLAVAGRQQQAPGGQGPSTSILLPIMYSQHVPCLCDLGCKTLQAVTVVRTPATLPAALRQRAQVPAGFSVRVVAVQTPALAHTRQAMIARSFGRCKPGKEGRRERQRLERRQYQQRLLDALLVRQSWLCPSTLLVNTVTM